MSYAMIVHWQTCKQYLPQLLVLQSQEVAEMHNLGPVWSGPRSGEIRSKPLIFRPTEFSTEILTKIQDRPRNGPRTVETDRTDRSVGGFMDRTDWMDRNWPEPLQQDNVLKSANRGYNHTTTRYKLAKHFNLSFICVPVSHSYNHSVKSLLVSASMSISVSPHQTLHPFPSQ